MARIQKQYWKICYKIVKEINVIKNRQPDQLSGKKNHCGIQKILINLIERR